MKKHWLKNECLKSVVLGILFASLMSFALFLPAVNYRVDAYNTMSIYVNSAVDFVIPSPGKQQINELENYEHIDSVIPYYYTKTSVNFASDKSSAIGIIMFEPNADLDKTVYTKARLIEDKVVNKPAVYVDHSFAKANGAKCDDNVSFVIAGKKFDYVIAGIYENNELLDDTTFVIRYTKDIEEQIIKSRANALPYSGAYVISAAAETSESYFINQYKPMGLLKSREEFSTDESYEIHKKGFYEADYSKQITILRVGEASSKIDARKMNTMAQSLNVLMVVFSIAFYFGIGAMFFNRNKPFYNFSSKRGVNTRELVNYQLASSGVQASVSIVLSAVFGTLVCLLSKLFFAFSVISASVCIFVVSIVASSLVALIMFALLTNKIGNKNCLNKDKNSK